MAPEGEIDIPRIQLVGNRPDGVGAVEADQNALRVRLPCQERHVQQLPAGVDHGGEHRHLHLLRHRSAQVDLVQGHTVTATHYAKMGFGISPRNAS